MTSLKNSADHWFVTFVFLAAVVLGETAAFGKVRALSPIKARPIEVGSVKGVVGEASLTVQQAVSFPTHGNTVEFQDGKNSESIEFFRSPRCYLHLRNDAKNALIVAKALPTGHVLRIAKIDNIYANGSVHVTFYFDEDSSISDLSCITNYNHTLTPAELKSTLGGYFQIAFSKSVEENALFNAVPKKSLKVLSEESAADEVPIYSARIILTDS